MTHKHNVFVFLTNEPRKFIQEKGKQTRWQCCVHIPCGVCARLSRRLLLFFFFKVFLGPIGGD